MPDSLILASTSSYRQALLKRLHLPFTCVAPEVDETPLPGEAPATLARRLALAKARSVACRFPGSLVIGSDQVASIDGQCIGKPLSHTRAVEQLRHSAGRAVEFHTAVALCGDDAERCELVPFTVHFRALTDGEIERYLLREAPYDCAGSFKWEGLGITLFERLCGDDPTALEGLPLIRLAAMLRESGLSLP